MNRKIKFRVWEKSLNRFLGDNDHFLLGEDGQLWWIDKKEKCYTLDLDIHILQQFTGLLDKNNREIYEGDICNIRRYEHLDKTKTWIKAEVLWGCEHGWTFRSYYNGKNNGDFYGTRFVEVDGIEVIGNIHESPELLTP